MSERIGSFEQFWPYYLSEHESKTTRLLHFAGTSAAMGCVAFAVLKRKPSVLLTALLVGYGTAWASHFFVEKNRPASFRYPLWSLAADFKMWSLIATGRMDAELARVKQERDGAQATRSSNGVSSHETAAAAVHI